MVRMLDFRQRSQFRRTIYAKPTILLLFVLGAFVAHSAWGMYQKSVAARERSDHATAELEKLRTYEKEINKDIEALSTERGQEAEIRDRFMVAREGEKIIVVSDPDKDKVHTVTVSAEPSTMVDKLKASIGDLP